MSAAWLRLAVGSVARSPQLPDVPTVAEQLGVPGLEVITWYGSLAPAGTPKEVIARLCTDAAAVMESPDVRERIMKAGADVAVASTDDFTAQVKSDTQKYGKLIKALGLKE